MQTRAYFFTNDNTSNFTYRPNFINDNTSNFTYRPNFDPICTTCSPAPIGWEYRPTPMLSHEIIMPIVPFSERCAYCQRRARADEAACAGCGAPL